MVSGGAPLPGIEHVVVLMLENRSFDNVFGGLYPELTRKGLYRGLLGTEKNPLDPKNPDSGSVTVFQGPAEPSTWVMPYPDPGELYSDMVQQIFGADRVPPGGAPATMSGFAWNYKSQPSSPDHVPPVAKHIMQYYSGITMPVSAYLARQHAVCDCWFASGPVQTLANRVFTHCGTPGKLPNENKSRVNNPDFTKSLTIPFDPPITNTTIFQLLDEAYPEGKAPECSDWNSSTVPLNWKIYYHDVPLSALCKYVYDHWCMDYLFGGNVFSFDEHLSSESNFEYDIKNGLLPKYSFIEPRYSDARGGHVNSNHPGGAGIDWSDPNGPSTPPPVDVRYGERFLCKVYSILRKYPEVFRKTLLIVTYDEHGGLFDHVKPQPATSPFREPVQNFDYNRYGVRVPAILINPSIKPGTVYPARRPHEKPPDPPFDHTSILSTLIAQFGLSGSLSPRVRVAPLLEGLVPATPVSYDRPSLVCPEAPEEQPLLPQRAEPRAEPRPLPDAQTLAGALGPLYRLIEQSKQKRRP